MDILLYGEAGKALVVQWIGRKIADLVMQVRILPRAQEKTRSSFKTKSQNEPERRTLQGLVAKTFFTKGTFYERAPNARLSKDRPKGRTKTQGGSL